MHAPTTLSHGRAIAFSRVSASESARPQEVVLDGATLTPAAVALVARAHAPVRLEPGARERNAAAARAVAALLERGEPLYGANTGVGALSGRALHGDELAEHAPRLLRSHAAGAGPLLASELVRAAMTARANQIGAGGAGVAPELLDALVIALNAELTPLVHEFGSLGTGDLTALAEIALALLGEGRLAEQGGPSDTLRALRAAGIGPVRLGPRDGLAFMSANAVTAGHAALLTVDAQALFDAWLTVAALSFEAADADRLVLDARLHGGRARAGQAAVAARLRELLGEGGCGAAREPAAAVQDAYPFRVLPQVDGVAHDALGTLEQTVTDELNLAGENALLVPEHELALPNGNPHAAQLAGSIDGLRSALAQSAGLIAARVSALLDPNLTGLPAFLAARPGPESGAMMLEYTAHALAAEVRSLVLPVAAQTVSVARGVESHASLAPIAARRADEALGALRMLVATELVVAVRALRLRGREPAGAGTRALFERAAEQLDPDLGDRPLHPDIEAAHALLERWPLRVG
jgi:histidine ammonia-lyase